MTYPPHFGWIKVNTDGVTNGVPGLAGCGGFFEHIETSIELVL